MSLLKKILGERIVFLDGAFGTMVQGHRLNEADFRGERFKNHPKDLRGNNDLLCITRPDIVRLIHLQYLEAGADIIETNSFNSTSISQADYGLEHMAYELNVAAAQRAKEAVLEYQKKVNRPCFVAGAIGPTNKTLSLSPKVSDPGYRDLSFDQMVDSYYEQIRGLVDGGADLLLPETTFDTLNLKACIYAIEKFKESTGIHKDVILSVTITDQSGRTLSGQTVEAFWNSVRHAKPLAVGINCALGAKEMRPFIEDLSRVADCYVSCYPNAGLPNPLSPTGYDETPEMLASTLVEFAKHGWLNIVGGCCGTTPPHIKAIVETLSPVPPRHKPQIETRTRLSGLESLNISHGKDKSFIMVGERTNVTGSPAFARLIRENKFDEALAVARQQVENGANIIDINFDEGLIDGVACMERFLKLIASEPDISRVPIMIDSSKWSVIHNGLKWIQGKGIVNSISLKEGEENFLAQAREIQKLGAAVIVMAFDENGQAANLAEKVSISQRAYHLLTTKIGFDPNDIIFDPNVLTVATGMDEHNEYAVNFIEAVKKIKSTCPYALTSGGISNVSFSFRGNNKVREAIHAVFLYHAIQSGLDMGIVNAGMLEIYEEIEPELRQKVEAVVMNHHAGATEELIALASKIKEQKSEGVAQVEEVAWRKQSLEERISHALVKGIDAFIDIDIAEALEKYKTPLKVIEEPLMGGMKVVGELFGSGKMFLPQVVKSARVMKKAVAFLDPYMEKEKNSTTTASQGVFLIATVKGDVHDIGKNIVSVVLGCNGYKVIDLGVMVPWNQILVAAREHNVDFIGMSGLITPSLEEMIYNAKEMEKEGLAIPLLLGGATTSKVHTAVKVAAHYSGAVCHVSDASLVVDVCSQLNNKEKRQAYIEKVKAEQDLIRTSFEKSRTSGIPFLSLADARAKAFQFDWSEYEPYRPETLGLKIFDNVNVADLVPFIDWSPFFWAWQMKGIYPQILKHPERGVEAQKLFDDGQKLLQMIVEKQLYKPRGVIGFWEANSASEEIHIYDHHSARESSASITRSGATGRAIGNTANGANGDRATSTTSGGELQKFTFLRQQKAKHESDTYYSLADFVAPVSSGKKDYLGMFVASIEGVEVFAREFEKQHDDYSSILAKALGDRLAEAFTEYLHLQARKHWGYGLKENLTQAELIAEKYQGIRPAPGYPACPEHRHKRQIWDLLDAEKNTGAKLTESCAIYPASSVSGFYFSHPDSKYFILGSINEEQLKEYAASRDEDLEEARKWLAPLLNDY
jgi:5-methyltetrahydrofolate--homocysteine methyltransferase